MWLMKRTIVDSRDTDRASGEATVLPDERLVNFATERIDAGVVPAR